ncbi:MAG: helix-turn-helix domain-containing protein [Actinomycetota bacterium]|nr:helix-turn-helix domain-containing protein [Actinomycetota bacterium]
MAAGWVGELRARHRLSQLALAYRAGTTRQALSRIEQGRASPTVEMLARLAAAVGGTDAGRDRLKREYVRALSLPRMSRGSE